MPRFTLGILALFVLSDIAIANPVYQLPAGSAVQSTALHVAQVNVAGLADSDLRRLNFYAARCLETMLAAGDTPNVTELQMVRSDIRHLIDAAGRSGLGQDQVADYFQVVITENSAVLPPFFLSPDGQFNARELFSSVTAHYQLANVETVNIEAINNADMLAIQTMSTQESESTEPPVSNTGQDIARIDLPGIPNGTNPINRAVLERVFLRGNDWVIEVAVGDSLSQYATALYGNRNQYRRIYEANTNVMTTPDVLEVGTILVLPRDQ